MTQQSSTHRRCRGLASLRETSSTPTRDRIGPWRFLLEDLTTPLGSWLFLRLRPDAAEDDQADEALLEGFPARKDGVIRDLRESTKEDFGWIMTSL